MSKSFFIFIFICCFSEVIYAHIDSEERPLFNIQDYGALPNKNVDNSTYINKAIDACSLSENGMVYIPQGVFKTSSILLKSNIRIYLEKGAVLKGIEDLKAYHSIKKLNQEDKYYMVKSRNWNKALILGDSIHNIVIGGEGIIDGGHLLDEHGEEGMRGPHILFLSRSSNIAISGIRFVRASNYAIMGYDLKQLQISSLIIEEGWDGIHIRGGKDICIRNCRFYTGDDAIAGGLWEDMVIENCYMNSSCNGIRLIMPAVNLKIAGCEFCGPGKYPHRTSGERKRRNMLSGILLQPGAWFPAFGDVRDVSISNCSFDRLDNPFLVTLNEGNRGERICLEHIRGTRLMKAAASVENWGNSSFNDIRLSDISLSYVGGKVQKMVGRVTSRPLTDYRLLPCWGLYLRNLNHVVLRNIRLDCENGKWKPASCFDNVMSVEIDNVNF